MTIASPMLSTPNRYGAKCPHCKKGFLVIVDGSYPFNFKYLQCPNCDSTYNLKEKHEEN